MTKVVQLLKDMKKQLEKEGREDAKLYEDYKCWCKENGAEKAKAVEEAKKKIDENTARIKELNATSLVLKGDIYKLQDEVDANKASLDTATAVREEQRKEFVADTQAANQNIQAVKTAQVSLGIAATTGFLQTQGQVSISKVRDLTSRLQDRLLPSQLETLTAFVQGGSTGPTDALVGVLQVMRKDFEFDLNQTQADEEKAVKAFNDLKAAKQAEIQAGVDLVSKKQQEKASAEDEAALKSQESKELTKLAGADVKFAQEVEAKCKVMDKEYEERTKTRSEESEAVSKAIQVLDADEAHAVFASTLRTLSFLQLTSGHKDTRREKAANLLAAHSDARLATLALRARIDSFVEVKKAMDTMVADLKKEKQEEVKKRDFCIKSFNENKVSTEAKAAEKSEFQTKIDKIASDITRVNNSINEQNAEISEMNRQLDIATQNRKKQHTEFVQVLTEQNQTIELLDKAIISLKGFYQKTGLIAVREHDFQPEAQKKPEEPKKFKTYEKKEQGNGVIGLIQQIIADTKALSAESIRAEKDSVKAYEDFTQKTKTSITQKQKAVTDFTGERARSEQDLSQAKVSLSGVEKDLTALDDTLAKFHADCDALIDNFTERQNSFDDEMNSLATAKSILSGMN